MTKNVPGTVPAYPAQPTQYAGSPCAGGAPSPHTCALSHATAQVYQWASQITQAEHARACMAIENARLRDAYARKQAAEDAYSQALPRNGITYVLDQTGRWVDLLNREVEWAVHAIPQPPSEQAPLYIIKLKEENSLLRLTEDQFMRDAALIQALQELPGVQVSLRRSAKTTAFLLRKAIGAQVMVLPFYGGWQILENGAYQFLMSRQFSTHQDERSIQSFVPLPDVTLSAPTIRRFREELQAVADPDIRWLLSLWFHSAALTSLLDQLGYPLPLALCLDTSDTAWTAWAKQFFGWYGDPALSLDAPPQTFSKRLLCRKDQPLLVQDQRKTTYAAGNSDVLERAIITRQILWKAPKGDAVSLPLQAQPVILSSGASSLTCAPGCLVLELAADDLINTTGTHDEEELVKQQYLTVFLNYVRAHIPRLRELLEKQVRQAMLTCGDRLNEQCAQALGVLLAVDALLSEFTELGMGDALLFDAATEERVAWLTNLLEQVSWKAADGCGLAERFVAVARAQLDSGVLCACPTEYEQLPAANTVFYDEDSLYFTRDAFGTVCGQLNQSRPVVLKALSEAGLLCGKPINGSTVMTRTSIWNAYGIRKAVPVYRMPREAFDRFGDPLIFVGEGAI